MALDLGHPDLHWLVPLELQRRASDPDKQVEQIGEAIAEQMIARRDQPLYPPAAGLASHSIAAVRWLAGRLRLTPALASRKVFLVGDAERLVPQRANPEAANALLKALEEPPADTLFVLTSAEPESLLPTILSRVVRVRVARVPDSVVTEFAQRELGVTSQRELEQRVTSADGCIGRLFATEAPRVSAATLEVMLGGMHRSPAERYAAALALQPFQARGGFTALLDELLERLHAEARSGRETGAVVAAMSRTLDAREMAQGNVNPQLLAAVLGEAMWTGE
jgi:DNA polymerase-3 subunit delta'